MLRETELEQAQRAASDIDRLAVLFRSVARRFCWTKKGDRTRQKLGSVRFEAFGGGGDCPTMIRCLMLRSHIIPRPEDSDLPVAFAALPFEAVS
jgi:hypothetical protein